ncbi:hypothetical protein PFICI_03715 [Pestalotiopsis fici W106-1]|uniref:Uncharacterized protein n=1 Tax=Pestalotiopsis fici (strain W106-1 / CGMCC3.15140) TaxID=1229662 RepID=W3XI44_PESFW|nr:uncharacterized protein PFICI_03715 [Pestalotiopsis fici W106-1]ETS85690.1 hypothetical protein PFICI_03715 [Pestalotiopsis fici W106-1]
MAEQSSTAAGLSSPAADSAILTETLTTSDDKHPPHDDEGMSDSLRAIASTSQEPQSSARNMSLSTKIKYPAAGVSSDPNQGLVPNPPEETASQITSRSASIASLGNSLIAAILSEDEENVKGCLHKGANVNMDVGFGFGTTLHLACRFATYEVVKILLDAKASIKSRDARENTALMLACRSKETGTEGLVQRFLDHDKHSFDREKDSTDHHKDPADHDGDLAVNFANNHKSTALTIACQWSSSVVVEKLLAGGADIDVADSDGDTPLILAARYGDKEMMSHIISYHYKKHPKDPSRFYEANGSGENAFYSAMLNKDAKRRASILRLLSDKIPSNSDELGDDWKQTLLYAASEMGDEYAVHLLVDKEHASIVAQDYRGYTALHLACLNGHAGIAKKFLKLRKGMEVAQDPLDRSPWYMFVQFYIRSWDPSQASNSDEIKKFASIISDYVRLEEMIYAMVLVSRLEMLHQLVELMSPDALDHKLYELMWSQQGRSEHQSRINQELKDQYLKDQYLKDQYLKDNLYWLKPETPLQWCTYFGKTSLVWSLLRNPISSNPLDDMEKARRIYDYISVPEQTRPDWLDEIWWNRMHNDGSVMLYPPESYPRRPKILQQTTSGRDERSLELEKILEYEQIREMLYDPPSVANIPDTTYRIPSLEKAHDEQEARESTAIILDFYEYDKGMELLRRSRAVHDVIYASANEAAGGPEKIMNRARKAASEMEYRLDKLLMRWIHLPANKMMWMEDLAMRVYKDKSRSQQDWFSLKNFLWSSWHQPMMGTSGTTRVNAMCLKAGVPGRLRASTATKTAVDSKGTSKNKSANTTLNTDSGKLPYVTLAYCERKSFGETTEHETPSRDNNARETGGTNAATRHSNDIEPRSEVNDEERRNRKSSNRVNPPEPSMSQAAMSLDEFYYNFGDIDRRNENQVITRCFLHDKQQEGKTPRNRQIRNGDGVPDNYKKWPYLVVGQLWLCIIDEDTVVTSTHSGDGVRDYILETMFQQMREAKLNNPAPAQPLSVKNMSQLLIEFCVDFIEDLTWNRLFRENNDWQDTSAASKSVLMLFGERLNQVAASRKSLFDDFKQRMADEQKINDSKVGSLLPQAIDRLRGIDKRTQPTKHETHESALQNDAAHSRAIQTTAELLDEVKDILEELTILKGLVKQQQNVWERFVDKDLRSSNSRGPGAVYEKVTEMIDTSHSIHQAVNDLMNLELAEESRKQTREAASQGKTLMAFTIVTVIFTPLSFLTSLFALNIVDFQHSADGQLEYEPGWIYPILFCVAAGVIGPLMLYAAHDGLRRVILQVAQKIGTSYENLMLKIAFARKSKSDLEKGL